MDGLVVEEKNGDPLELELELEQRPVQSVKFVQLSDSSASLLF
jgi:hypothetical protein